MPQSSLTPYELLPSQQLPVKDEPEDIECKLQKNRYRLGRLDYILFPVISSLLIVCTVYTVLFVVKSMDPHTKFDPNSLEYALNKNSRFLECYEDTELPATTNCSSAKDELVQSGLISWRAPVSLMSGDKLQVYDESNNSFKGVEWCTVVGCVKQWDLKLVPSIPRDAAILPTMLRLFTQTAFICIGALYQMHKRRRAANRKQPKRCKGLRNFNVLDWLVHGWDLASLVWWWMTFSQFIVAPDRATAPFVLGWVTPWKYYTLFAAHPYCCVFRKSPRTVKAFRLVFYLLAAAQWCSMCYVVYLIMPREYYNYGTRDPYPSYDCDASRIAESPGMTTCSADQICNITNLFVDARFTHGTPLLDPGMSSMLLLGVLTAGAVLPVLRPVREVIIREIIKETQPSAWREKEKRILSRFQGMTLLIDGFMAATTFFGCMVGVFTVREVVTMYGHQADTMFAIDWECQAVHVFLSPWRYYLDIGYQRGLRIAQMWFNS